MDLSNAEKCAGRRASVAVATPAWLPLEDHDRIKEMYKTIKALNKIKDGKKFHIDHVVPLTHPLVCGLHVPWNLQLLTDTDNKVKGNTIHQAPLKGAILAEHIGGSLRYRGQFIKGYGGNMTGLNIPQTRGTQDDAFETFMSALRERELGSSDMISESGHWMIANSRTREELKANVDKFGVYLRPKMGTGDGVSDKDYNFTLKIVHTDN